VLTEDVVRSLSAPIYCRDLDTTPLRDLIDSEGKLIPEDPQPGVPRVGFLDLKELLCRTCTSECLSTWQGFTVFHCREPTTHLVMLSRSMTSIISSTNLHHSIHRSSSSSRNDDE
ncbi:hypothetical protein Tco_1127773, partial [Tanacetum coccineum]